jgi:hypothetical protein
VLAEMIGGPWNGLAQHIPELPPWFVFPYLATRPGAPPGAPLARYRSVYVQVGDTWMYTYSGDERY